MNKLKISNLYLWAGLLGLITILIPYLLGFWLPIMYFILFLAVASLAFWVYLNQVQIKFFFKTQYSSGLISQYFLILVALLVFLGANFLAIKYNRSFDITTDHINTLSKESLKVVKGLDKDIIIKVFYTDENSSQIRLMLKKLFYLYQKESNHIKASFLNAKWEPSAADYLTKVNQASLSVFVETGEKREMVADPISEESVTTAIIRLQSTTKYKVYFTIGHGEKSINEESVGGLSQLKSALAARGLISEELSLLSLKNGEMPEDLYALIIVGPTKLFSEMEKQIIKGYIEDGGRVLLAIDPEVMFGFNDLLQPFGIEYKNHFVVSVQSVMPLFVLGTTFNTSSPITEGFESAQVIFPIAGSLAPVGKNRSENVEVQYLVSTDEYSFAAKNPTEVQQMLLKINQMGSMQGQVFDLAALIKGKTEVTHDHFHNGHMHTHQFKRGAAFSMIAFADSDFMSNEHIQQFYNQDLVLNSIIYLTGQKDLITIRPNQAKPTTIEITSMGLNIGAMLSFLPFLIFSGLALFYWFKKRSM